MFPESRISNILTDILIMIRTVPRSIYLYVLNILESNQARKWRFKHRLMLSFVHGRRGASALSGSLVAACIAIISMSARYTNVIVACMTMRIYVGSCWKYISCLFVSVNFFLIENYILQKKSVHKCGTVLGPPLSLPWAMSDNKINSHNDKVVAKDLVYLNVSLYLTDKINVHENNGKLYL